jgi:hypothetical protein
MIDKGQPLVVADVARSPLQRPWSRIATFGRAAAAIAAIWASTATSRLAGSVDRYNDVGPTEVVALE